MALAIVAVQASPPAEALLTTLWFVAITVQFTWVLAPWHGATFARRWTCVLVLPIFLLPHLPVCKRGAGKAVGAAQGAAALVLIIRSFSMVHRMEEEEAANANRKKEKIGGWSTRWGRWRRVYQGMALGWHDIDEARVRALPAAGPEHAAAMRVLAAELLGAVALLGTAAVAMSALPPPPPLNDRMLLLLGLRVILGAVSTLAGFYLFDRAWRLLMCGVNRLAVDSIIGGSLWRSETVSDLWLAWNLPVQRLLLRSVYLPLRRRAGLPRVPAKLAVFTVSGCCHLWPCFCAGLSWDQLGCMMLFFVVQPALVAVEGALGLHSRVWAIGVELCCLPLFVLPLLHATDPMMVK